MCNSHQNIGVGWSVDSQYMLLDHHLCTQAPLCSCAGLCTSTASKGYWHFIMLHQFLLAFQLNVNLKTQIKLGDHVWPWGKFSHDLLFLVPRTSASSISLWKEKWKHRFEIILPHITCNLYLSSKIYLWILILMSYLAPHVSSDRQWYEIKSMLIFLTCSKKQHLWVLDKTVWKLSEKHLERS